VDAAAVASAGAPPPSQLTPAPACPDNALVMSDDRKSGRERLEEFRRSREAANARIHAVDHLGLKRFFALDTQAYQDGALSAKAKEMLGLVASAVLRCNDCIDYHLIQCVKAGYTDAELQDALNVALVVGGSIVIPHLRHAYETLELLRRQ
jgi:AhpD family alkylhydroperoxidase